MRTFLPPLLFLLCWASTAAHALSLSTAQVSGNLRLNSTTVPLDTGAVAVLSPLSPSSSPSTSRQERVREVFGPRGEYAFAFDGVAEGEYVLRFVSRRYAFQDYHILVSPNQDAAGAQNRARVEAALYSPLTKSAVPGSALPHPLVARSSPPLPPHPHASHLSHAPFSLFAFLKSNPMVWLMVLGVGLAVGFPRLIAMLDEETVREVGRTQEGLHKTFSGGGGRGGSFSSLLTPSPAPAAGEDPSENPSAAARAQASGSGASATGGKGGGGGGKARKRK
ncbi:hypothetical protein JCM6882_009194 [Rhodosporidiobolus microsporus]